MTLAEAVPILAALVTGVLVTLGVIRAAKIELDKSRPETIDHGCRLARWNDGTGEKDLKVYSYFLGRKEHIGPSCVFLDKTDFVTCNFGPTDAAARAKDWENAKTLKALNNGKCYIALFADNSELAKRKTN